MSDITVAVEWEQPLVFAGDEIRCKITFRNAAATHTSRSPSPSSPLKTVGTGRDRWKLGLQRHFSATGALHTRSAESRPARSQSIGHRSTISLNAPVSTGRDNTEVAPECSPEITQKPHKHNRSVSIISIGSQPDVSEEQGHPTSKRIRGVQKHHGRSTSFQGLPIRSGAQNPSSLSSPILSSPTSPNSRRSTTAPLSLQRSSTFKHQRPKPYISSPQPQSPADEATKPFHSSPRHGRNGSDYVKSGTEQKSSFVSSAKMNGHSMGHVFNGQHQSREASPREPLTNRTIQRVLSPVSIEGTPRSSIDFYAHSNNSSETLASEYMSPSLQQQISQTRHIRQSSHLAPIQAEMSLTDTLMMGYVQLLGSFTLDGSLVNMAPFEIVKRRGVIGGQGSGGVVGVEHSKRDSGLFGSLGWSNIGQSLGGLLGSQEPSSIREMKGIANSKSIPILSTPQSILFVDLKLRPGESKSFTYCHPLPKGVPPSHKGRAFKSSYQLIIGTQRAKSSDRQHMVRQVDIPFRVMPGVDLAGEILGHDLMNPHILLNDMATTHALYHVPNQHRPKAIRTGLGPPSTHDDSKFTTYVERLLQKSRQDSNLSLMSPTEPTPGDPEGITSGHASNRERIDIAISRSHSSVSQKKGATRFQIHRDGIRVANIILGRSAYRIGETISTTVDLSGSEIPCYSVNITLETSESVDPAIALRSGPSIHRATKRVHAFCSETTISAQKMTFDTIIPINATPEFVTTGIRLDWKLKLEFVTGLGDTEPGSGQRLEQVTRDERGSISVAVQELPCRSFEVAVPIRVYGYVRSVDDDMRPAVFPI